MLWSADVIGTGNIVFTTHVNRSVLTVKEAVAFVRGTESTVVACRLACDVDAARCHIADTVGTGDSVVTDSIQRRVDTTV